MTRSCPLCGGTSRGPDFPYATVWKGERFDYLRCGDCGCVFVDPVPTAEQLSAMYSREVYHDVHYSGVDASRRYARSAAHLRSHSGGRKRLLDFGCGTGSFLAAARDAGFDPHGIEFTSSTIEGARRATGLPVTDLAGLIRAGARFEIIHMSDVLEHLPDPRATLLSLLGLLEAGGLLHFEGPLQANTSLVYATARIAKQIRRAIGLDRPGRTPPTHLILATRSAQRRFFQQTMGLREVSFEVYETGWPYVVEGRAPTSAAAFVKLGVGLSAVVASRLVPGRPKPLGNRFNALYSRS